MSRLRVTYDEYGVPTICGASAMDVSYGQGYVAARYGAWQLDAERRRSYGTTAEVFGPAAVPWDAFARQLELPALARQVYDHAPAAAQDWLAAYSAGVNRGLTYGAVDAPEFARFSVAPQAWQPWDSLAIFVGHNTMTTNFGAKIMRHRLQTRGFDELAQLFTSAAGQGSNAWAIPSDRTGADTGVLLAADPHRIFERRGVYHQVRLQCPDFDVVGLAFAGVPGVPHFGHNTKVSWVTTSAMANYQDLYVEADLQVNDYCVVNAAETLTEHRQELITIAGQDSVAVDVGRTAVGQLLVVGDQAMSFLHPARELGQIGLEHHLELLSAGTAQAAARHFDTWVEPINRVILADTTGDLVSRFAGRVPIREQADLVAAQPTGPVRWRGWVDTSQVESTQGVLAHANEPAAPGQPWSVDFCSPARHRRIRSLAQGSAKITATDCAHWQQDTVIPLPKWWLSVIAELATIDPDRAAELAAFDGTMDHTSIGASWFDLTRHLLTQELAAQLPQAAKDLGPAGVFAPWCNVTVWLGLALDAILTAHVPQLPPAKTVLRTVAQELAAHRQRPLPWGQKHQVSWFDYHGEYGHAPMEQGRYAGPGPVVSWGGDADALCATSCVPGLTSAAVRGPVARVVWDVQQRERSKWLVPSGTLRQPGGQQAAAQADQLIPVIAPIADLEVLERHKAPVAQLVWHSCTVDDITVRLQTFGTTAELDALVAWVQQDRAAAWGMVDKSAAQIREIYHYLITHPSYRLMAVYVDDVFVMLVHFYDPHVEPVGAVYEVLPGDVGMHLITGPPAQGRMTANVWQAVLHGVAEHPSWRRLVIEPDVENVVAIRRAKMMGFTVDREVSILTPDLSSRKRAALSFLDLPMGGYCPE